METLGGISIPSGAEFGPGLYIGHFGGIIIGEEVVAGENCTLSQGVTLGEHRGSPMIGACVYLAPGAKVFGPIRVGDHVAVGANAVVSEDVPSYATAVAGRATVLERARKPDALSVSRTRRRTACPCTPAASRPRA